ncbi:DUF3443 family protein [Lichenibacterium dinghuense]|uniref:DUF3443 family protein n=1 Tax=Lichenibacterium dinghuense TaxID=2895977 RepID=UPI001F3B9330|nr:DUF3443 family protein [Lichenibacterium sp. 6Y81]
MDTLTDLHEARMPSPSDGGAREVVGTLTFGVGTAADHRLGASGLLRVDAFGRFTTTFDGRSYPASYIDSGTETYLLNGDHLPRCRDLAWAYCMEPRRTFEARMTGSDGNGTSVRFALGDYQARREGHAGAVDDVAEAAGPQSAAFVWGAPFFLGRKVTIVVESKEVPSLPGPVGPFYGLD